MDDMRHRCHTLKLLKQILFSELSSHKFKFCFSPVGGVKSFGFL